VGDLFSLARRFDQMMAVFATEHRHLSSRKQWNRLADRPDIEECARLLMGRLHHVTTGSTKLDEYVAHDPASTALHLSSRDKKRLAKEVRRSKELNGLIGGNPSGSLPRREGGSGPESSSLSEGPAKRTTSSQRRRNRHKKLVERKSQDTSSRETPHVKRSTAPEGDSRPPTNPKTGVKTGPGGGQA